MKSLYAPWRELYRRVKRTTPPGENPFKHLASTPEHDEENGVLVRLAHTLIILNKYPYNAGHLLVIPKREAADLVDLPTEELHEFIEAVAYARTILQTALNCDGLNIGLNIGGRCAGGSVPEHLHMHIVPRWNGDTNFMVVLADCKPISFDLASMYRTLKQAFDTHPFTSL